MEVNYIKSMMFDINNERDQYLHINLNPSLFKTIKNPYPKTCRIAIERDPRNISYIPNPSIELQLLAVTNDSMSITRIIDPHISVQKIAIDRSPSMIKWIKDPTEEIQEYALVADVAAIFDCTTPSINVIKKYKIRILYHLMSKLSARHIYFDIFTFEKKIKVLNDSNLDWPELSVIKDHYDGKKNGTSIRFL